MRISILIATAAIIITGPGCGGGGDDSGGEQAQDLQFTALVDNDGDGLSHNDMPVTINLSDYFAENQPGMRAILVNAAAGWCDPCAREAGALPDFVAEFQPQGVAVLSAVFQDQNGDPCDETFARLWAETFSLTNPVLIDTEFQTSIYFDAMTMPANMIIDAETREILFIATGADTGPDPLREYREFLEAFLAQP